MRKTFRQFIKEHRNELDQAIKDVCPNCQIFNDHEREAWVLNNESLYMWARSEGVKI